MDRQKRIQRFGGPYAGAGRSVSPFAPRLPAQAGRADIFSAIKKPRERSAGPRLRERRQLPRRAFSTEPRTIIPPLADGAVRVIPLSGVEEIGRNMLVVEYRNDIIIMDMGLQFNNENTPGIDYILPNTTYLEERKEKIRAVFITHGHLDHIGGIPYLMPRIGNPPLYTRNLTALMIKKRQEEFAHMPALDIKIVEKDERIRLGGFLVRFFGVTHSIPDAMGIIIETPHGNIVNPGDFKLDHIDGVVSESEEEAYAPFEKEKTLLLLGESTNVENPGFSTPESVVGQNLSEIVRTTKGRLIVSMFASHVTRIAKIIEACGENNKKVAIEGRSMRNNVDICIAAGLLKPKEGVMIRAEDMANYPPDRIVILATGAQGDEFAAMMRMATKTHKTIHLLPTDTVVLSSSIIPGNERTVEKLKDNIARHGTKIVHYRTSEMYIHSTGHGNRAELEWLHKKVKPRFFVPTHGNHYRLRLHAELALSLGVPKENIIVPDNGSLIDISADGTSIKTYKEKAPANPIMVDGFSVGGVQEVVLRDRQMLAEDGMFVIIASVNGMNGKLRKSPDIISRGFVYLRESQDLLNQARIIIKKTIEDAAAGQHPINFDYIKDTVTDNVSRFLFQKTAKRPVVIPVLIGV
ncbi:MAG: ribonuclease J [Parcubacteria group bacterium Gr01-1014_17]|nr:MAG: ribonuclease J [Parcubacteria group bacterium Gr01-1014_17]